MKYNDKIFNYLYFFSMAWCLYSILRDIDLTYSCIVFLVLGTWKIYNEK